MNLHFTDITLDRQDDYRARLQETPQVSSDYSYVNLWAWAEEYGLSWAWHNNLVWIRQTKPTLAYWAPVGPWPAVDWRQMMPNLLGCHFVRLPEALALLMAHAHPQARIRTTRDHWDYIYSVPELVALAGNRFHAKVNLLRQFQNSYLWRYQPVDVWLTEMMLAMQSQWCAWRNCENSAALAAEDRVIAKVLRSFATLPGLVGGALVVDAQVVAFTVAEPLQASTLVIHFEKGMSSYKGVYQAINREFLATQQGYTLVNREQDLGDDGLRKAKLSYNPVDYVRKYELLWL